MHGICCPMAWRIFLDQGLNQYFLHWQADFQPLDHQGSPSHEYSRLIFFRIDWFDLFAIKRTLKGVLQHHSLKAPIIWCSAFFMVQLSYLYTTTGKTIALIIQIFVIKVMPLLFFFKGKLEFNKHVLSHSYHRHHRVHYLRRFP